VIPTPLSCLSPVGVLFVLFIYSLPVLIIGALVIVIPIGAFHALTNHRRDRAANYRARGLCPICAYNLRASPGRCPECGARPHQMIRNAHPTTGPRSRSIRN
jgi:hypothetical protein